MKITINDDNLYKKNIFIPISEDVDLAPYEMFGDPKFTSVLQTDDNKLLINEYSMISQSYLDDYAKQFKQSPAKLRCLLKDKKIREKELYPLEQLAEIMHEEISNIIIPWIANNIKWRRFSPLKEIKGGV